MTPAVQFFPDSTINEFDCGEFRGHVSREPERRAGWCNRAQGMVTHRPAHWSVTVNGINGAWRAVLLPLKRGRTMARAVADACAMFNTPADITPDAHGYYGATIDTLGEPGQ